MSGILRRDIRLAEITGLPVTQAEDFNYAGIPGTAELIGWKIMLFRAHGGESLSAVSMSEIETAEERRLCNRILQVLGFPVGMGADVQAFCRAFGTDYTTEDILTGSTRYCWRPDADSLIAGEFADGTAVWLEIVCSREIADSMI